MTSYNPHYLLKASSSVTITLGVSDSTYEFGGHSSVHSTRFILQPQLLTKYLCCLQPSQLGLPEICLSASPHSCPHPVSSFYSYYGNCLMPCSADPYLTYKLAIGQQFVELSVSSDKSLFSNVPVSATCHRNSLKSYHSIMVEPRSLLEELAYPAWTG